MQRSIAVVLHHKLNASSAIVQKLCRNLQEHGIRITLIDNLDPYPFGVPRQLLPQDTELVIVLGGDGAILGTTELVYGTNIPILGINMGHVGFLAELEQFQTDEAIDSIIHQNYSIEERNIASVTLTIPGQPPQQDWALNEIVIEKTHRGKMIELAVSVDHTEVSSFGADGIIIATPTGSTAYGFSAGGPILWPTLPALEIVPIAAYSLFARPMIIGPHSELDIQILNHFDNTGYIVCDGRRDMTLPEQTKIHIALADTPVKLVRLNKESFTERLITKFQIPVNGWKTQTSHDS